MFNNGPVCWSVILALALVLSAGCAGGSSQSKQRRLPPGGQASQASVAARQRAYDLAYCTTVFFRKEGRWPLDYAELQDFVEQSGGFLALEPYEDVQFTPVPPDRLEISYRSGPGVRSRMTLDPPFPPPE